MTSKEALHTPLSTLTQHHPFIADFCLGFNIDANTHHSITDIATQISPLEWEERGTTPNEFITTFIQFIENLNSLPSAQTIHQLEVLPGFNKNREPESCQLLLKPGEITCIVGPTGSGKSRLLADIEWLANRDTPTNRQILLNGELPDETFKNNFGGRLIAQITQNMNFVLDMNVNNFLLLHAQSHYTANAEEKVTEVIELANQLSGESFTPDTPVTFLSGGQSRALMIADVACIGQAPIVLIDEIENAGVDKKRALQLLTSKDKIVLMATHDPLLILMADKRVVIKNGGIHQVLQTNKYERALHSELEKADATLQNARQFFRNGHALNNNSIINS